MIKRSSALKANCRWTSISIGTEAVPRRLYKTFVQVIGRGRWGVPSMRNLLDKSSVAQSLDGSRLTGSLRTPTTGKLVPDTTDRKRRVPIPAVNRYNAASGHCHKQTPLASLHGDVGVSDDALPQRELVGDQLAERFRRAKSLAKRGVELGDDGGRRAGRRHHAKPERRHQLRIARFDGGRYVRQGRRARRRR